MESIGEVVALSGEVRALSDSAERILAQGNPIYQGETIVTGHGAQVQIQLADESILAQGEDASQTIDKFIYDPANASGSNMLINMAQGTLRMVTGKVGEANPEGVAVKTPLATIGIRGTGIDLDVRGGQAKVGCFQYDGMDVTITGEQGTRILNAVNTILDILADGTFGEIRSYSDFEQAFFKAAAPIVGLPGDQPNDNGQGEGQGNQGDQPGNEDGDNTGPDNGDQPGQNEAHPEGDLAQLFQQLFGTEEQPTDLLKELFTVLTGSEAEEGQQGNGGQDTLVAGDDDDDDTQGATQNGDETKASSGWTGDEDGSTFDTSHADHYPNHTYGGTASGEELNDYSDQVMNEVLRGYDGNDTILATSGADTLFGGAGDDYLSAESGDNLLIGGTGNDEMHGGYDSDQLYGGSGSDYLDGGQGNDTLDGGTGSDVIHGGAGTDQLTGGADEDYFLVHADNATDLNFGDEYNDFSSGDMLIIDKAQTNWNLGTDVSPGTNFFEASETHDQYVANGGSWTAVGDSGYSMADGGVLVVDSNGNLYYDENPIGGSDTAEYIGHFNGTAPGENSIKVATFSFGDGYNNTLNGTTGYDFIAGLGGDDVIKGGQGADTLYGGLGADQFKYEALSDGGQNGAKGDLILDFHSGEDSFYFDSSVFVVGMTDSLHHPQTNHSFWTMTSAYGNGTGLDDQGTSGDKGFVFDSNGDLWYDPDLGASGDAVHIAHVDGDAVRTVDITMS